MSRMMQPRDQMSDLLEKENLRASGAIQDFWQGSAGRIKVEGPLSAMFPGDEEQDRASALPHTPPPTPPHYHSSFGCFERGSPISQLCLEVPIFLPPPLSAETTGLPHGTQLHCLCFTGPLQGLQTGALGPLLWVG